MLPNYKLIVFDWEGTLQDSLGKILNLMIQAVTYFGLDEIDIDKARIYLTHGLDYALKKLYPGITSENLQKILLYIEEHAQVKDKEVFLMPRTHDLIKALSSKYFLAIATNRSRMSLERDLALSGFKEYFPYNQNATDSYPKPSPDMLQKIMDFYGVKNFDTLMIGDSVSDIEMAQSLNVDSIGVNFYDDPINADELLRIGALFVITSYNKLLEYFKV